MKLHRGTKRSDLAAEEIKRWIAARRFRPGDRLPKEGELQAMFAVSKGTIRETLKSLEVQGLVTVSTGPAGGARVVEVPLERTFQFLQNYLFFKSVTVHDIYAARKLVEPELAASAVPHLTQAQLDAMERSIQSCAPAPLSGAQALSQRQEDLHFHDIFAEASPNQFLALLCKVINQMLRHLVVLGGNPTHKLNRQLGASNLRAHRAILLAARRRDAARVRKLMHGHILEAEKHVMRLHAELRSHLVLDSDMRLSVLPRLAPRN